jgi:hypothetical protein
MAYEAEWIGISGRTYTFVVVPWPAPLDVGVLDGNYICARQSVNGEWIPIYIGEGDLADPCLTSEPAFEQMLERGVTHLHCHINDDPAARRRETRDLLLGQASAGVEPYPVARRRAFSLSRAHSDRGAALAATSRGRRES